MPSKGSHALAPFKSTTCKLVLLILTGCIFLLSYFIFYGHSHVHKKKFRGHIKQRTQLIQMWWGCISYGGDCCWSQKYIYFTDIPLTECHTPVSTPWVFLQFFNFIALSSNGTLRNYGITHTTLPTFFGCSLCHMSVFWFSFLPCLLGGSLVNFGKLCLKHLIKPKK